MSAYLKPSQQKTILIATTTSAALSLISSAVVAAYVLASKERRAIGYHRIILAISVHSVLHSSAICFGSAPIPDFVQPPIYGASGTVATCEAQGFIQQLGGMATSLVKLCVVLM